MKINQFSGKTYRLNGKICRIAAYSACLLAFVMIATNCQSSVKKEISSGINSPVSEEKIDSIVGVLSLEEKVNMLCGNGLFTSPGVERLGIRELHYSDGPFGIREELGKRSWGPLGLTTDSATFLPTGSALAAGFNPDMAYRYGVLIGEEAKTRGKDILLGPAINITRTPLNGRTFEYMSEDPYLNSRLAVNYVLGVQSTGVASCVKHFAANNQETRRGDVNVTMDERTLQEIYLPAFKAAVTEGHAHAVMAAYNKFRGYYCAENEYLLNKILKGDWNFKGLVMSDWGGTHSTVNAALHGLDVEMGSSKYFNKPLLDSVKKGLVPESVINDKVKRILRVYFFSHQTPFPENKQVSTPAHMKTVYDMACQTIVLLKNSKKLLPVQADKIKTMAVIGDNAIQKQASGGFGAGVKARYEITPLAGLKNRIGNSVEIKFAPGYKQKFTRGQGPGRIAETKPDEALIAEAVKTATSADVVLLFVGDNREVETEATDRTDLTLPFGQDGLIKAVCAANPNTIIVVISGAPVDLHSAESLSSAILWSGFNGSEGGNALADVILGKINPSGKLPFTFPSALNDSPAHALKAFPGTEQESYTEGILVGYRWFDTKKIQPMYPFGYGLSYTTFTYNGLRTDKKRYSSQDVIHITLRVKNTGKSDGMEAVQLYVSDLEPKVPKAMQELKGLKKIMVPAGKESEVALDIRASDLSWFDEKAMKWVLSPGKYKLSAGSSSRDIRGTAEINIQ
jgi:beta-glucosidase